MTHAGLGQLELVDLWLEPKVLLCKSECHSGVSLTCVKDEDVIHNPFLAVTLPTAKHHEVLAKLSAGLAIASAGRLALNLRPREGKSKWW